MGTDFAFNRMTAEIDFFIPKSRFIERVTPDPTPPSFTFSMSADGITLVQDCEVTRNAVQLLVFADLCSDVRTDAWNEGREEKWILSPVRLPVSPPGQAGGIENTTSVHEFGT